jgi:hypothetical protein
MPPLLRGRDDRQPDRELSAPTMAAARSTDGAPVQLDDALREREPEAEPSLAARERLLRLRERLLCPPGTASPRGW